jgi:hypothetical protein
MHNWLFGDQECRGCVLGLLYCIGISREYGSKVFIKIDVNGNSALASS